MRARERWSDATVLALMSAFAVLSAGLAWARFSAVHNRTFDLALYARQAWGLVHGQFWDPIGGGDFLGGHLAWVLLPLGALGRALGTVPVLLCVQSAAIALSAWPLYRLAASRLGAGGGVAVAAAWLLQPNLGHVATYEFHPGTLALWPLMHACCGLERAGDAPLAHGSGARALWVGALGALACRVSLALPLLALAVVAAYRWPRVRRVAWLVSALCAGYFALWLLWLQPSHGAPVSAELHFGKWGGSPFGALRVLLQDPARVFEHLLAPARASYLLRVLAPFALLPLLAPRWWLPALAVLGQNLLSEFPTTSQLYSHYLTPALPPLAVGAVAGAFALRERLVAIQLSGRAPAALPGSLLLLAALAGSALAGGLPGARGYDAGAFRSDADTHAAREVLARITPGTSIQAPDRLLPHLAERPASFRAPPPERSAQWLVLDVAHRRRFAQREDLLRTVEEPRTRAWLARGDHQLVHAAGDLLLLRRGAPVRGGLVQRYLAGSAPVGEGTALCACLALRAAELRAGAVVLELVARSACASDLALRIATAADPARVDLPFDGLLSPAQLRAGDRVRSRHALSADEQRAIGEHGLRVGALRSSGARPEPGDPISVQVRL